jgi:hypothetical protein
MTARDYDAEFFDWYGPADDHEPDAMNRCESCGSSDLSNPGNALCDACWEAQTSDGAVTDNHALSAEQE